jgi:hypothetical protein
MKMSVQNMMATQPDPNGKWLYRVGGVCAFILVVAYLLTFPLYAWVGGGPPSGVEARLAYFAKHATGWWVILGLMVFTDLLYVPIWLSLYRALKGVGRDGALLAAAFAGLFVVLDLALTWTAFSVLITSGGAYTGAATDAQRTVLVAAAGHASAVLDSPLLRIYAVVLPSLGIFFAGLVMRRGAFNKATVYLALAVGISGIVYLGSYVTGALDMVRIINALLVTVWFGFVGCGLYKLGRQESAWAMAHPTF